VHLSVPAPHLPALPLPALHAAALHLTRLPVATVLLAAVHAIAIAVALAAPGQHALAGCAVLAGVVGRSVVRRRLERRPGSPRSFLAHGTNVGRGRAVPRRP
jgi:hypothetical protein